MDSLRNEIIDYIPGLRRYAMSLTRNHADADELVQESLCRAIERMRPWRNVRNRRAYLYTILHNLYVDRFVKSGARREIVSEEIVERKLVMAPSQFYRIELRELDEAVQSLPDEHRDVILLIGLEGLSYRTAASVLDIPVGTVMSRLSRARDTLRQLTDRPAHSDRNRISERSDGKNCGATTDDTFVERRAAGRGR